MRIIYVIKQNTNNYGERHIEKVVRDEVIHYKSGIYVTKHNGFVKDTDAMLVYNAKQLHKLLIENAWNGYFSKDLCHQWKTQSLVERTLTRNKIRQIA